MDKNSKREQTSSEIVGLVFYGCYLYFLTHPEKADEIKWWVQDKWEKFCISTRHSLDFWESVTTYSRRIDEIRSLPEIDSELSEVD